jgi:hypothetical protein
MIILSMLLFYTCYKKYSINSIPNLLRMIGILKLLLSKIAERGYDIK